MRLATGNISWSQDLSDCVGSNRVIPNNKQKASRRKWFHAEMTVSAGKSDYSVAQNMADDDFELGKEDKDNEKT